MGFDALDSRLLTVFLRLFLKLVKDVENHSTYCMSDDLHCKCSVFSLFIVSKIILEDISKFNFGFRNPLNAPLNCSRREMNMRAAEIPESLQ